LICWQVSPTNFASWFEVYAVTSGQRTRHFEGGACGVHPYWLSDHTAVMGDEAVADLFDLTTGKELQEQWVTANVAVSPHGRYAIGCGCDGGLLDIATGQPVLFPPESGMNAGAISPHETYVAFAYTDSSLQLWNIATAALVANIHGHAGT